MTNIKKITLLIIKSTFIIALLLIIILFFYSAFIYEPLSIEKVSKEKNEIEKKEEIVNAEEEKSKKEKLEKEKKLKEQQTRKKIQIETVIEDGIYATIGNKAITRSDIVDEIKTLLILSNKPFIEEERPRLEQMAIKNLIKRKIKKIEIEKNDFLQFNDNDLQIELRRLANNMNMDLNTLKNVFKNNELDILLLEERIKVELLWNSLIFQIYKNKIQINLEEVEEQLKSIQSKKIIEEYLISEIVIEPVDREKIKLKIEELKNKIKADGFENTAATLSIANSSARGGDLGWVNENLISKKLLPVIANTSVGNISEPVFLPNGILFFKVRDKRKLEKKVDMEKVKNELVNSEKSKILNMHSTSHFNNLRRAISIKFFK